jgi:hypothetical protein
MKSLEKGTFGTKTYKYVKLISKWGEKPNFCFEARRKISVNQLKVKLIDFK